MRSQRVVVVGAGHAGINAAIALREDGFAGQIDVFDASQDLPYERPPLSKAWMKHEVSTEDLSFRDLDTYRGIQVNLHLDESVVEVDRNQRCVLTRDGSRWPFETLILATGAAPRDLPISRRSDDGIYRLHSLEDARRLRPSLVGKKVVVLGGGFIGLEVAAVARHNGGEVRVVEAAPRLMGRAVSEAMSSFFLALHEAMGVSLMTGATVKRILHDDQGLRGIELTGGETIDCDLVVAGIGVRPNTDLAERAGLAVDDGVLVDGHLRTNDPNIFAIGDCARFPYGAGTTRLESVQNAGDQAHHVASGILGDSKDYQPVPWFWTHQFDCRLQIAGLSQGADEWVLTGDTDTKRFSVLCWKQGRLIAGESVNRPADHVALRRILGAGAGPTPDEARDPSFSIKAYSRGVSA